MYYGLQQAGRDKVGLPRFLDTLIHLYFVLWLWSTKPEVTGISSPLYYDCSQDTQEMAWPGWEAQRPDSCVEPRNPPTMTTKPFSLCRSQIHPLSPQYINLFLNMFWLSSTNVTGQQFYMNLIQSYGAGIIYWNSPFFPASLPTASPFLCPLKQFGAIFQIMQLLCMVSFSNNELIIYYSMFQIKGE